MMGENIAVNVTLPKEAIEYIDEEAEKNYLSRATLARQLLLQKIDEIKVVQARRNGYSIRKIAEMYTIPYTKVLEILHLTQVDAEEKEADEYVAHTMKVITKSKE